MSFEVGRIGIWTGALDAHSTAAAQDAARHLEQLGYTTLWIPEAVGREPFVAAANLLAATSTLKLATGIANIYARDPMTTAAAQLTLAEAYPERFLLGLGVSHRHLVHNVRKHDYSKPLSYMRDYLAAMKASLFMATKPAAEPATVLAAGPEDARAGRHRGAGRPPLLHHPRAHRHRPPGDGRRPDARPRADGGAVHRRPRPGRSPGPACRCTCGRRTTSTT
ncbi:MAG: LLM class flavin-dependent oxidoreductase [Acidimicrobiales bacterium]